MFSRHSGIIMGTLLEDLKTVHSKFRTSQRFKPNSLDRLFDENKSEVKRFKIQKQKNVGA